VSCLIAALSDPDARVRSSAAESLGRRAESTALPGLVARLDDTDDGVRLAGARAVRKIVLARAVRVEGLDARLAREDDPAVKAELQRALGAAAR
jgi:HEAT repeat protein